MIFSAATEGRDRFVLTAGSGSDLITDLTKGEDLLVLPGGLTFAQLTALPDVMRYSSSN